MIRTTHLSPISYPFSISYRDNIISLGSCFSVNIGNKLSDLGYTVHQNPAGITYNPVSLSRTLKMVSNPESLHDTAPNRHLGVWSHPDFHGSFSHPDKTSLILKATESLTTAQKAYAEATHVLITLGTAHVHSSRTTGSVVNNCHKLPADQFSKRLLDIEEILSSLTTLVTQMKSLSSASPQFLLSVSPVRHIRNGLQEDRLSKSLLMVATHKLAETRDDCHYFPAYELLTDVLRDYRYYAEDLVHPSPEAVDLVYDLFEKSLLNQDEAELRQRVSSIVQRQQHRPRFPDTEEHRRFLTKLEQDISQLQKTSPEVNLTKPS